MFKKKVLDKYNILYYIIFSPLRTKHIFCIKVRDYMSKNFISIRSLSPSDKAIIEKAFSVYCKKVDNLFAENVISLSTAIDKFNYPSFLLFLCRSFLDGGKYE